MRYLKFLFILLIWSIGISVNAACDLPEPHLILKTNPGTITYHNDLSKQEFMLKAPNEQTPDTAVGLTVARMNIQANGTPQMKGNGRKSCVGIKDITFEIGFDQIDVYIDRKYKPGSCEYKIVKEHEDHHAQLSRQAMIFFKPDIEKALRTSLKNYRPRYVHSKRQAEQVAQRQFEQLVEDVRPVIDHVNKVLAQKNAAIDTPASYRQVTAQCDNW